MTVLAVAAAVLVLFVALGWFLSSGGNDGWDLCRRCRRRYAPPATPTEIETLGLRLCQNCFRDLAFERVLGPRWRTLIEYGRGMDRYSPDERLADLLSRRRPCGPTSGRHHE